MPNAQKMTIVQPAQSTNKHLDRLPNIKVKVSGFCIATFTERSLTSTALQVGRLQVRTTHGAACSVAFDGLAPSHPSLELV
jgi:hypothetical protein